MGSFEGINVALDRAATSGSTTLRGSRSITEGSTETEWRFNNVAEVLGETIELDLGGDRGVTRVRMLPGATVEQREQFFLKGCRLEAAPADDPAGWVLVAQQPNNTHAEIMGRIACASGGRIAYRRFSQDLSMLGYAAAGDVFGASLYEPFGQSYVVGNIHGSVDLA